MAKRIKSAIKRHRQSLKRRARNQGVRTSLKRIIKTLNSQVESGDREQAERTLRDAVRSLDRAATKGVIHRRKASRLTSRLSKKVHQSFGQAPPQDQ